LTDTTTDDLPLAGVRILAAEHYGAGPFGTMYMADMGAEIIKIEAPPVDGTGGDSARQSGPHFLGDNDSHFFQTFNLGKRSLTLNLRHASGQAVLHRLVEGADAVINNLRGDLPGKLGLTYADLGPVKPSIVCAHLSGYGRMDDRAGRPAYDYLMQAEAGFMSVTGEPDGLPTRMGLSIVDFMTGLTTAFALTAALFGAARSGKGRDVDVTLYDVAIHQMSYPATWYLNEGTVTDARPRSGHPSVVPCEMFPTSDGHIFIMCVLDKFWRRLCELLGCTELLDDPRFASFADRRANRDALAERLDAVLITKPTAEWMAILMGQVPVAPVYDFAGALDNPYLRERGGIGTFDHPMKPGFKVLANPILLDGKRVAARPGPALGADTDALLAEVGYSASEIEALRQDGAV